ARSYSNDAKDVLAPWLIEVSSSDNYQDPPPITESSTLLSYKDASRVARQALRTLEKQQPTNEDSPDDCEVWFPLGLDYRKVQAYKIIKRSQFLFRTPIQRMKFIRAINKFAKKCGCGPEVLSMRRSHSGRRSGSIMDIAQAIHEYIRNGGDNITKALNLTRSFDELEHVQATFFQEVQSRKEQLKADLYRNIDARQLDTDATLTGWFVTKTDMV
ncbi:MAG TPA: hypothetical protein VE988_03835, partial [Gemmataceae bacterium]|nr:hypothetical protein [Gemmataceae bacterium]